MSDKIYSPEKKDRREFLKSAGTALIGSAALPFVFQVNPAFAMKNNTLKVGLIGCGGRGTGAALQALKADTDAVLTSMGDIFFDYLDKNLDEVWSFVQGCGNSFLSSYLPIVQKRKTHPYSESNKEFQEYRRGRYVEFNLVFDRGTLFGLQSGGRTESILMSMPPLVRWEYGFVPAEGSAEALLYQRYLQPQDWLGLNS